MLGYLTVPGVALAVIGVVSGARRHRAATALLGVWTLSVLASALLLALWPYPRYFAAAIVPLSAFVALGAVAVWDALVGGSWMPAAGASPWRRSCCRGADAGPALREPGARRPGGHALPGADLEGYVAAISAQTWVDPRRERDRAPRRPVSRGDRRRRGYTWGLDLRLNGAAVGSARRFDVFSRDGREATSDARARRRERALPHHRRCSRRRAAAARLPPLFSKARPCGGAVTRLYERTLSARKPVTARLPTGSGSESGGAAAARSRRRAPA